MNSYLVVSFSEGGNARHFFFGPLFVAGSRLQAMLFQTFKLAHSAKVRRETGNKKKGACGCFLRRGKCSPFFFWPAAQTLPLLPDTRGNLRNCNHGQYVNIQVKAWKQEVGEDDENVARWLARCKTVSLHSFGTSQHIVQPLSDYITQIFPA